MNIPATTRQRQQAVKVSRENIFDMVRLNIFRGYNVNIFPGMYSDNETVDVASSDETEEDDDNDVNEDPGDEGCSHLAEKPRSPSLSDILHLGHNNLDFLSEIYNTAFSKVPKVIKHIQLSINPCLCGQFKLIAAVLSSFVKYFWLHSGVCQRCGQHLLLQQPDGGLQQPRPGPCSRG